MNTSPVYLLDTNVLLYSPEAILAYPGAEVVISVEVLEELDKFKNVLSETGNNARTVSKMLDEGRAQGNLAEGILLPNQARLRIELATPRELNQALDPGKSSNRILGVALALQQQGKTPILITQESNLRVKANAFGVAVRPYEGKQAAEPAVYQGWQREIISAQEFEAYHKQKEISREGSFCANEGLFLINEAAPHEALLGIYQAEKKNFRLIQKPRPIWEIEARNPEQQLVLELLLDPRIAIVSLMGKAGTGKTLLALAAGLQMMLVENHYSRLLVSRPIFPMGRDLGYLPGELQEKLAPWMQPIFDNLEFLISSPLPHAKGYQELISQGLLVIEPLTYIRGRSIPHQYMIVDEAQNLTPHEIKTIITRVGEGTKIVLTGDPYQIDNPYVNSLSNGLSYIVEKFKPHSIAAHVTLVKGERSPLAELAANIL